MSFSNAPGEATLGRVAGALAVDEAFVEKDWYVVQAIRQLVELGSDDLVPVFSGGTSLLKAYGLIKRFSEDIDFKFVLSEAFLGCLGCGRGGIIEAYLKQSSPPCGGIVRNGLSACPKRDDARLKLGAQL